MTSLTRAEIGALGENLAVEHLTSLGLQVLDRNWRCRYGELDVIAADDVTRTAVFVEVKTRTSDQFGGVEQAVTPGKVRRLRRLAGLWLAGQDGSWAAVRIDVIVRASSGGLGEARRLQFFSGLRDPLRSPIVDPQCLGGSVDRRAITGSQLFPHSNPAVVISRHLNAPPPLLGDLHLISMTSAQPRPVVCRSIPTRVSTPAPRSPAPSAVAQSRQSLDTAKVPPRRTPGRHPSRRHVKLHPPRRPPAPRRSRSSCPPRFYPPSWQFYLLG